MARWLSKWSRDIITVISYTCACADRACQNILCEKVGFVKALYALNKRYGILEEMLILIKNLSATMYKKILISSKERICFVPDFSISYYFPSAVLGLNTRGSFVENICGHPLSCPQFAMSISQHCRSWRGVDVTRLLASLTRISSLAAQGQLCG